MLVCPIKKMKVMNRYIRIVSNVKPEKDNSNAIAIIIKYNITGIEYLAQILTVFVIFLDRKYFKNMVR